MYKKSGNELKIGIIPEMTGSGQNGGKSHLKYNNRPGGMCKCCSGLSFFIEIIGKIDKIR